MGRWVWWLQTAADMLGETSGDILLRYAVQSRPSQSVSKPACIIRWIREGGDACAHECAAGASQTFAQLSGRSVHMTYQPRRRRHPPPSRDRFCAATTSVSPPAPSLYTAPPGKAPPSFLQGKSNKNGHIGMIFKSGVDAAQACAPRQIPPSGRAAALPWAGRQRYHQRWGARSS